MSPHLLNRAAFYIPRHTVPTAPYLRKGQKLSNGYGYLQEHREHAPGLSLKSVAICTGGWEERV